MKDAVVDASVAAKWVIEEDHTEQAILLLTWDGLHAPAHWRAETVNVLWAKVFRGDLEAADATDRMMALNRAPVADTAIAGLLPRAFAISVAHAVTIYDSLYLALAEQRDIPMVTADAKLVRRMSGVAALRQRMIWIGDLSA